MNQGAPFGVGQIVVGPLFPEPMRVETVQETGTDGWAVGLVGTRSQRFRRVTLTRSDLAQLALELRGLAERILIVCPSNLAFQWQRELKEKFDEKFLVLEGGEPRPAQERPSP